MVITSVLCVELVCAVAAAQTAPTSEESPRTWDLPGLSGTAAQIKVELHQELDDLNTKIAAAEGDVRASQADLQKRREAMAAQLGKSNDTYQYICKTIADSQTQLPNENIKARADELKIKIDGFTKRRRVMEDQAMAGDAETQKMLADEAGKITTVNNLKSELAKRIDWRCQLGSAVRGGEMLRWPVVPQETGIVGRIRITGIDNSGLLTAQGQLFVPVSQDAKKLEGIITLRVRPVPALFLISGWTDHPAPADGITFMDQVVRVVSIEGDRNGKTVRVERFPSDEDAILDDFREFRKPNEGDLTSQ